MSKLLPYVIGGLALAGVAVVVTKALAPTPAASGHNMAMPDLSQIAQGAPIVKVKLPAELSPLAQMGKVAFDAKCSTCHGENAAGRNGKAPPLVHPYYRPGHHADAAFLITAQAGVRAHHWPFGNMPPVKGVTQADVKAIVAYVRTLQDANGIF
ncbi:c-type cytochrome [Thioclava atlantica]|uniref:Cytochrome c class I n=1 Tax=Thioclava atlantica TaxID=1317124 RepID=A0A085U0N7_9RHOB|nr:cytochrome c [Thioclava atlantica]KFE36534.1 cytochrome c class I [Thioclava atlantica]